MKEDDFQIILRILLQSLKYRFQTPGIQEFEIYGFKEGYYAKISDG